MNHMTNHCHEYDLQRELKRGFELGDIGPNSSYSDFLRLTGILLGCATIEGLCILGAYYGLSYLGR
jgi:hypothetical protein